MIRKRKPQDKGIALVVVLMALLVLATVAGGMTIVSSHHLIATASGNESQSALYAAKAGAWMKLGEIRNGNLDDIGLTAMSGGQSDGGLSLDNFSSRGHLLC